MTIVYFYQYFGTSKGGWSTRVYEMTRRWVKEGHKVIVVTSPYDKSDIPKGKGLSYRIDIEGIEVIVLNFPQTNKVSKLRRMIGFGQYMALAIYYALTLKFDVAVCSSGPITVGYMGLAARFFRGKKFVFEVRDLWPAGAIQLGVLNGKIMQKWAWWFEKRCYKRAHLIVAASQGMKANIEQRYGFTHIIVVPNASDNELFGSPEAFSLPEPFVGKDLIMYTGSLGKIDHCMDIMEAASVLDIKRFPNAHILCIGEGVDRAAMEDFKNTHNLNHVTLLGLMPKTELAKWLQHALVSILTIKNIPMLHTCSPNKIFDAFAAGKPIIQTTVGWIKDFTEKEQCGLNVAPENPAALAKAFEVYLENKPLAALHGENAKRLALTVFSRDHCAKTMLTAMEQLIEPGH